MPYQVTVAIAFLLLFTASCRCDKEDDHDHAALPSQSGGPSPASTTTQQTQADLSKKARLHMSMLTPEQISNRFFQLTGKRKGFFDLEGNFHDAITEGYAAELGGIDYVNSSRRQSLPTLQSMLVVKQLAWSYAIEILEADLDNPNPRLLTHANLREDKPLQHIENEMISQEHQLAAKRWDKQYEQLYWTLYLRPPTPKELVWGQELFLRLMEEQTQFTPAAWVGLIYAMLTAEEFWLR